MDDYLTKSFYNVFGNVKTLNPFCAELNVELNFIKTNPAMNMTVFVKDRLPEEHYAKIADKLMSYDSIYAEQIGYIEPAENPASDTRLHMMGGEFCGNAVRSLAVYTAYKNPEKYFCGKKDVCDVIVEVYGEKTPLTCSVKKTKRENLFYSTVSMPLPISDLTVVKELGGIKNVKRLNFDGITHFAVNENDFADLSQKEQFFEHVKSYMQCQIPKYKAFGIMFYDKGKNFITPLVYVKPTNSLFWEKSCASGTSALACILSYIGGNAVKQDFEEPGGKLSVSTDFSDIKIKKIVLGGDIEIVAEGKVFVDF